MALENLDVTENWESLEILTKAQLHAAMLSVETNQNTNNNGNFQQLGLDVFGSSYVFNNDGIQTETTPLVEHVAFQDEAATITAAWAFTNTVSFSAAFNSTSLMTSSGQYRARAYRVTTNQSVADNTATALSFAAETYDVGSLHDTGTNPSRFTIPSGGAGLYLFHAQATFAVDADGYRKIAVFVNGVEQAAQVAVAASAATQTVLQVMSGPLALSSGDYVEAYVHHTAGNALDIVLGQYTTYASLMKVW